MRTEERTSSPDGVETELAELYDEHGAALYRFALELTGNERRAEDAVVEGFATLWREPKREARYRGDIRTRLAVVVAELACANGHTRRNGSG